MKVEIKGFDEEVSARLKADIEAAIEEGPERLKFWAQIMESRAILSIKGDTVIITKEG